jgi:hypothetical protein
VDQVDRGVRGDGKIKQASTAGGSRLGPEKVRLSGKGEPCQQKSEEKGEQQPPRANRVSISVCHGRILPAARF